MSESKNSKPESIDIKIGGGKTPREIDISNLDKSQDASEAKSRDDIPRRTSGYGGGGYGEATVGVATADISKDSRSNSKKLDNKEVVSDDARSTLQNFDEEDLLPEDIYGSEIDLEEDLHQHTFSDLATARRKKPKKSKKSLQKSTIFSTRRFWLLVTIFLISVIAGLVMLFQLEQAEEGAGIIFNWL